MWNDIRFGLKKPSTTDEQLKVGGDVNAMRRAIDEGRRDSALIHRVLMSAECTGLSGEDKYVMLAYHALIALEEHASRNLELTRLMPSSTLVVDPKRS